MLYGVTYMGNLNGDANELVDTTENRGLAAGRAGLGASRSGLQQEQTQTATCRHLLCGTGKYT